MSMLQPVMEHPGQEEASASKQANQCQLCPRSSDNYLNCKGSGLVGTGQHLLKFVTDALDHFFLIEKVDLALCGRDVDIDAVWSDLETEIDERICALRQDAGVQGLEVTLERCTIDEAICALDFD